MSSLLFFDFDTPSACSGVVHLKNLREFRNMIQEQSQRKPEYRYQRLERQASLIEKRQERGAARGLRSQQRHERWVERSHRRQEREMARLASGYTERRAELLVDATKSVVMILPSVFGEIAGTMVRVFLK